MPEILPANEPVSEAAASRPPRRRLSGCAWVVICFVLIVATIAYTMGWPIYRANSALAALRAKGAVINHLARFGGRPWYLRFVDETVFVPGVDSLEVGLVGAQFADDDVQNLAALGDFNALEVGQTSITTERLRGLAELPSVGELWIDHADLSDDDLAHILQPHWQVYVIGLSSPKLTQRAWESIVRFKDLDFLRLHCAGMTLDGALPDLSSLTLLRNLRLEEVHIAADGVKRLAALPRGLQFLQLFECRLDIVDFSALTSLGELNIEFCDLTAADMSQFRIPSEVWGVHLKDLSLVHSDPEIFATLSRVEWLELERSTFTDEQLNALVHCPRLKTLTLTGCKHIGDAQVPLFGSILSLKFLDLTGTSITAAGIRELKSTRPKLNVISHLPAERRRSVEVQ